MVQISVLQVILNLVIPCNAKYRLFKINAENWRNYHWRNIFSSIPDKGISLATNQQMLPSSMRGYAPVVRGLPTAMQPLPFVKMVKLSINLLLLLGILLLMIFPPAVLVGTSEITIEEEDGSKRVYTQTYSSLPIMLREGQFEYEFSAGQYDGGITTDSKK